MARRKPRALKSRKRAGARTGSSPADTRLLGELIANHPRVLRVLDDYGITFCAGCYLTLMSSPERAAVYHAVPRPKKFLKALEKALR